MTVPGNIDALLLGGQRGYQIERSLRFNSADSAYLNRTPASAGNRKTWTWSGWAKICKDSTSDRYIFAGNSATTDTGFFGFGFTTASTTLFISGWATNWRITTQVFRDFSAWYHIVVALDTTQATANDRVKVYVNGVQVTAFSTTNNPTQNADLGVNTAAVHYLSSYNASAAMFDGYLTEVHFIDGQALTPSSFGETDTITGVWKPKKYAGTYGTNGFYLKFADNSGTTSTTLGKDSSGNGNNWTPNNFSVTAGAGNDSLIDTPTPYADGGNGRGNYCTLNPLDQITGRSDLSNGNLDISTGSTTNGQARSTLALPSSGKHYFEATVTSGTSASAQINVGLLGQTSTNTGSFVSGMYSLTFDTGRRTVINGTLSSRTGTAASSNDVIQVAVDMSTGNGWVGQNNTWYDSSNGTTGNPATGANPTFTGLSSLILCGFGWTYNNGLVFNFGQRAFAYTPPSGFLVLNTQNLPEPSIKKPSSYFNSVLWTGNGTSQAITGVGHQPDFLWSKARNQAYSHRLHDAVRGREQSLLSNSTGAEFTQSNSISSFDTDGFTVGSDGSHNGSTVTYVGWSWKESATPGFDIVTYTGNGTSQNISHNLGVAPSMVIVKQRIVNGGGPYHWHVWHSALGANEYLLLSATNAKATDTTTWNNTAPTSTVFSVGSYSATNLNNNQFVAYLWSEVAGFSKFGSYVSNGSSDGPFVYCGFRPRWILVKATSNIGAEWILWDTARTTYNLSGTVLSPDTAGADAVDPTGRGIDIVSNGFKIRCGASNNPVNNSNSNDTYIFAAFAESPFKYSLAR